MLLYIIKVTPFKKNFLIKQKPFASYHKNIIINLLFLPVYITCMLLLYLINIISISNGVIKLLTLPLTAIKFLKT
jgi:hypothetical protein